MDQIPDIRKILERYEIYYEDDPRSPQLLYLCPFHDDHNVGSAGFDEEEGVFYCFACGEGGNIYQFVSKLENCSIAKAQGIISSNFKSESSYDVQIQRKLDNLGRSGILFKEYKRTYEKGVINILSNLVRRDLPYDFYARWVSVLTFFSFVNNGNVNERNKQFLDCYGQFFKEMSNFQIEKEEQ